MPQHGYQFFELLVVCLLLSVVAALFFPQLEGIADQEKLQSAARNVVSSLAVARVSAISTNTPVSFLVEEQGTKFSVSAIGASPLQQSLPEGIVFESWPQKNVIFYSRGNSAPSGSFVLKGRRGRLKIIVAASGRIRWERMD
ncbi:MAG: GspH/FimT family protein [Acidobacteria bacterium]|nr:GspH/FimT family protein [Acidobacteriota bacterium]